MSKSTDLAVAPCNCAVQGTSKQAPRHGEAHASSAFMAAAADPMTRCTHKAHIHLYDVHIDGTNVRDYGSAKWSWS